MERSDTHGTEIQQQSELEALKISLQNSEAECESLRAKLSKSKEKSLNTTKLVELFKKTSLELETTKKELDDSKRHYVGLMDTARSVSQQNQESLRAKISQAESKLSASELKVSEQSILIVQLRSQLDEVNRSMKGIGSPAEAAKEILHLKQQIASKNQKMSMMQEQLDSYKLRMKELVHDLKRAETKLKQKIAETSHAQPAPSPHGGMIDTPVRATSYTDNIEYNDIVSAQMTPIQDGRSETTSIANMSEMSDQDFARDYGHIFGSDDEDQQESSIKQQNKKQIISLNFDKPISDDTLPPVPKRAKKASTKVSRKPPPATLSEIVPPSYHWKPLKNRSSMEMELNSLWGDLLRKSLEHGTSAYSERISSLLTRLCCSRSSKITKSLFNTYTSNIVGITSQWESKKLSNQQLLDLISTGPSIELPFVDLVLNLSNSFIYSSCVFEPSAFNSDHRKSSLKRNPTPTVNSSPQLQFIDLVLLRIHRTLIEFDESIYQEIVIALLARLYVTICRKRGLHARAKMLLFDGFRESSDICLLFSIACISSWPSILCNHPDEGSGPIKAKKSYFGKTIEIILSTALASALKDEEQKSTMDSLIQIERNYLIERHGFSNTQDMNLVLQKWTNHLVQIFTSLLQPKLPIHSPSSSTGLGEISNNQRLFSHGMEILRSLELIANQVGFDLLKDCVYQPMVHPMIPIITNPLPILNLSLFPTLQLAIATCGIIGRAAANSKVSEWSESMVTFLLSVLDTRTERDLQITTIESILELQSSYKEIAVCQTIAAKLKDWYKRLPPLVKVSIPSTISNILKHV